jgi:curved DNA-binding protein CbpA
VVDYYKILGIKRDATAAEIKSAYRRLAREQHPDHNAGSDDASLAFARIAHAYRTLNDPQERAFYDSQLESRGGSDSVFETGNPYAWRMRRFAAQRKWDRAVDLCLEAERQETFARTQTVFTTVSLFLSTFIVAVLKPRFWESFDGYAGRAVLLSLFLVGMWHLASRLRDSFERYTYQPKTIQESIIKDEEEETKPFTRSSALAFLVFGSAICVVAGLFVGVHTHYIVEDLAFFFSQRVHFDMLFYPPIAVLIIDTMHSVANKID